MAEATISAKDTAILIDWLGIQDRPYAACLYVHGAPPGVERMRLPRPTPISEKEMQGMLKALSPLLKKGQYQYSNVSDAYLAEVLSETGHWHAELSGDDRSMQALRHMVDVLGVANRPPLLGVIEQIEHVNQDQAVIQAVRNWYATNGDYVPERIVVVERQPDVWRVSAGPKLKEAGFDVDPATLTILRYYPGD